jgi:hypothetical protein
VLNFSCWRGTTRNVGAPKLLTPTHKCTSFYRILLLPSFVLAPSHSFVFYCPTAFHTPEYIRPLTFYDSYFPQTPQSLCTDLSKLNCSVFLFPLCVLVGSYCATKKLFFHLISTELLPFTDTSYIVKFETPSFIHKLSLLLLNDSNILGYLWRTRWHSHHKQRY